MRLAPRDTIIKIQFRCSAAAEVGYIALSTRCLVNRRHLVLDRVISKAQEKAVYGSVKTIRPVGTTKQSTNLAPLGSIRTLGGEGLGNICPQR